MNLQNQSLDELCINTIRFLSVDGVQQANSGHPGMPMGAAPMAYVLWSKFLRHSPRNPDWPNRDHYRSSWSGICNGCRHGDCRTTSGCKI